MLILRRRRDRIAALVLISVFSSEPDVHVLSRKMPRPTGHIEKQRLHPRRLHYGPAHFGNKPLPPKRGGLSLNRWHSAVPSTDRRRCDSHGSPKSRVHPCP